MFVSALLNTVYQTVHMGIKSPILVIFQIDLANFELFSSPPRDFSVSLSDRFPTRDWRSVGHFTAQNQRDMQSFNLDPHLLGKFIKVELHSHYGSEHYCPISLFRVYGTTEFEVLETEGEVHESVPNMPYGDDDDEPLDVDTGEPPRTLFGSAQDAVMSIVKKAAQVLVKGGGSQNDTTIEAEVYRSHSDASDSRNCVCPSHIVVCDNCSDAMFSQVYELLSCQGTYLQSLIDSPFVHNSIESSELCLEYGLDFSSHRTGAPYPLRLTASGVDPLKPDQSRYLSALLPSEYIAALCNILAIHVKKVVFNSSYEVNETTSINFTSSLDGKSPIVESNFGNLVSAHHSTCTLGSSSTSHHCISSSSSGNIDTTGFAATSLPSESVAAETTVASQIKPTKTLINELDKKEDFPSAIKMKTSCDQGKENTVLAEISSVQEPPAGTYSTITVSIYPKEENHTGAEESLKESVEEKVKTSVNNDEFIKVEMTEELPTVTEIDHQQIGGNEKQSEAMLEEKYQESQESLSLDSLFFEQKDLDIGMDPSSNAAANPATVTTTTMSPPSLAHTQQVQKESVLVRLFNRVKV